LTNNNSFISTLVK